MRIIFFTKRQYTNKDLIDDKYGRSYEIPLQLVRQGNVVSGLCLSYRNRKEGHLSGNAIDGDLVDWHSINLSSFLVPNLYKYQKEQLRICDKFQPDVIIGCSDALHIILASNLSQKTNTPFIADLYDNFESFGMTRLPGIMPLFKKAVRNADGVITVSSLLQQYVEKKYSPKGLTTTIVNGTDTDLFRPLDKNSCRDAIGLPRDKVIIGTAGALDSSRGIECLFTAFSRLSRENPTIHLALAGRVGKGISIPDRENVYYLGELKHEIVPTFFNSLDVCVICNKISSFGRYCYPQKAQEIIACGIPLVAAKVGANSEILSEWSDCLYKPDDSLDMANIIKAQIYQPISINKKALTWSLLAQEVDCFLRKILNM